MHCSLGSVEATVAGNRQATAEVEEYGIADCDGASVGLD